VLRCAEHRFMNHLRLAVLVGSAFFAFAACAGSSTGMNQSAVLPGSGPSHRATHAHLRIKVPPQKHHRKIRVRGHYISPATASLTYAVTPALSSESTGGEIDISTSNPNCHTTGVAGYLTCTIDIAGTVPGTPYTFSFITWDAAGGTGNQLSANDGVPFTANAGQNNELQATLGGIASSFAIAPMPGPRMSGSNALYDVYGSDPVKFSVVAMDADDNFILGPGAPQPSVVLAGGAPAAIASVGPNSPNEWALTSTYSASDPTVPSNTSLTVSATPVPGSGGSTVNATIPIALYQPWIYIVDGVGVVRAYDENGNTIAAFTPFTLPHGATGGQQAIAFGNHRIYAYGADNFEQPQNYYVAAFPPQGGPAIVSADETTIPVIGEDGEPGPVVFDSANGEVYAMTQDPTVILAFDGNLTANLASNDLGSAAGGLAYIASTQQIGYSLDGTHNGSCDEALVSCSTLSTSADSRGGALGFDAIGNFFGTCSNAGGVQLMDLNGVLGARFGSDICSSLAFDPYSARWYSNVSGQTSINAYTESGSLVPSSGGFPGMTSSSQSMAVAP
jgi:hypothetical protein